MSRFFGHDGHFQGESVMKASAETVSGDVYSKLLLGGASLPGSTPPASVSGSAARDAALKRSGRSTDAVSVDLSASHDVFAAVDNFFDLNSPGKLGAFDHLSPEEKGQALKMVAELGKRGYVGYETLLVDNHKVERHDVVMEIGDDRLRNARVYHGPQGR
jgi:hypothetical protein